jgi:hypothetical protein
MKSLYRPTIDSSKCIIKRGKVRCVHHEEVCEQGEILVGTCIKCGRIKNYTILHDQIPELGDGYSDPDVTMNMLMKSFRGSGDYFLES